MDIHGFILAFDKAQNAPSMAGHRVLMRRLRELIDAGDISDFRRLMDEVNQKMPGSPLSDLAQMWSLWKHRDGEVDDLIQTPTWQRWREEDETFRTEKQSFTQLKHRLFGRDQLDEHVSASASIQDSTDVDQPKVDGVNSAHGPAPFTVNETAFSTSVPQGESASPIVPDLPAVHAVDKDKSDSITAMMCIVVGLAFAGLLAYVFLAG